ncbi:hypothetical protein ACJMK2_035749 [Sinanodonta woodiana]|uniref:Uncharacterized protein n=1 Tax=Sinanodonta woodiana TaxID=1069815 RepID=A0ABD3WF11_SINWO
MECFQDNVECLMKTKGVKLWVDVPPPLCCLYERPDMDPAIQNLFHRFNSCLLHESQCSSGFYQERQSSSGFIRKGGVVQVVSGKAV